MDPKVRNGKSLGNKILSGDGILPMRYFIPYGLPFPFITQDSKLNLFHFVTFVQTPYHETGRPSACRDRESGRVHAANFQADVFS